MGVEVAGAGERFAARRAAVGLLAGVHPPVAYQLVELRERLVTRAARVRLLARVNPLVQHEVVQLPNNKDHRELAFVQRNDMLHYVCTGPGAQCYYVNNK